MRRVGEAPHQEAILQYLPCDFEKKQEAIGLPDVPPGEGHYFFSHVERDWINELQSFVFIPCPNEFIDL